MLWWDNAELIILGIISRQSVKSATTVENNCDTWIERTEKKNSWSNLWWIKKCKRSHLLFSPNEVHTPSDTNSNRQLFHTSRINTKLETQTRNAHSNYLPARIYTIKRALFVLRPQGYNIARSHNNEKRDCSMQKANMPLNGGQWRVCG